MSDRRVTFRLLALKADTVSALIGLKSAVNEPAGTTTTAMIKSPKGLWTVILGPFEPNLYEYQYNLDGVWFPFLVMTGPNRSGTSTPLLLIPGYPPNFLGLKRRDRNHAGRDLLFNRHLTW